MKELRRRKGAVMAAFMTILHNLGALAVLLLITAVGIYSGKKVKGARDFIAAGRSAGTGMVAGSLIGTLVGGSSTIGTAQLAFSHGFSAWWFTLGGGIGLLVLGLVFAKPLYNSGLFTLPQMLTREYGKRAATAAALLMSLGTFMSIISQFLSGAALITSVSSLGPVAALCITLLLMAAYVLFGGVWGTGMAGMLKTLLLYAATLVCGLTALRLSGGYAALRAALPAGQYFSLFARGYWKDGGAGASLLFGVLTTQAYILPVISAKSLKISRAGAILGGLLTIAIGIAGIFVGMYMRLSMPDIPSAAALPRFILTHLPGFTGGVILATLLVALVGTGAGLALGIGSMLCNDIYKARLRKAASDKEQLGFTRAVIAAVLILAAALSAGEAGSLILSWGFFSMGLRGAVAFAPLCFALFAPGRVSGRYALAAIILGPAVVLIGFFTLPKEIDPLFPGMAASLLVCFAGYLAGRAKKP